MKQVDLLKVFELFTAKDREIREVMYLPFQYNQMVCATDGSALIYCDIKHCNFTIDNPHTAIPNIEQALLNETTHRVLSVDKSQVEHLKTEDEYTYIGEDIECKTCNGDANVEWEFESYTKYDECPACDGSGSEKQKVKTVNKTFSNKNLVQINNTLFAMPIFYKLLEVKEALGEDIILLNDENRERGFLFGVGFLKIILMPLHLSVNANEKEPVLKF